MKQDIEPVVSFIVPVYNVRPYLEQCIASMLEQTEDEYEIILIDDESTDGSGALCRRYAEENVEITSFHQKNQGVSVARNQGLSMARGRWICFVDGDDWVEPELVQGLKEIEDTSYDIIFFAYHNVDGEKKESRTNFHLDHKKMDADDFLRLQMCILNQGDERLKEYSNIEGTPWAKLYRRSFLEEYGLKFTPGVRKGQDGLFNMQAYGCAKCGFYSGQAVYNYRINDSSVCRRYNPDISQYSKRLIMEYQKQLKKLKNKSMQEMFDYFVVRQFMYCILLDFCHKGNKAGYVIRRRAYLCEKEKYKMFIGRLRLKNMKLNEKGLLILIRYFPFWCLDRAVKFLR